MDSRPPPEADDAPDVDDWTAALPQTDHVQRFFRNTNWEGTSLGPLRDWSQALRTFVGFVFADSRAACLWWGADYVAIYNEEFIPLCAGVHPMLMGQSYARAMPEIWPAISALFVNSRRTGRGNNVSSATPLLVERNGYTEEAYFSGSFVPVGPAHEPDGF
jgi:hypothetical protein